MKKRFIAIALISALLCGCASQAGTSTASNMGGTLSISDFESELESTGGSVTSEPEVESKPVTTTKPVETTTKPAETTTKPAETTTKPAETTTKPATTSAEATKKPAETTTKKSEATSAPETTTTSTTTKPAPEWTETKVSGTKYVNTDCYSRKKAVLGAETVKIYNVNDKVKVIAKTNTGYFKLDTGAFIHGDYLSDSKIVVQTTVATTTKKQETPKPAAPTPKPSASADPVDAIRHANNPPFIDEDWLAQKYGNDVVTSEKGDWYLKGEDWYYTDGRHMDGRLPYFGICKTSTGTWTVGKDLPEGWYAIDGSDGICSSKFDPDVTSIIRSNGYSIPREIYYGGGVLYLANGDKLTGTAALMPISKGKVEDYAWYEDGVKVRSDSFYVGGKGLAPGKYKITEIPELRDSVLCGGECFVQVNSEYIYIATCGIKPSTITIKTGDFVHINNVKLTKIS